MEDSALTIRWLMTAVRALWSPLKQWRLRARHSNSAWLHICSSWGPNESSRWEKYSDRTVIKNDRKLALHLSNSWHLPVQRRMCVAMCCSCCLKKDMLVCVTSTPSNTVTEDSLCGNRIKMFCTINTLKWSGTVFYFSNTGEDRTWRTYKAFSDILLQFVDKTGSRSLWDGHRGHDRKQEWQCLEEENVGQTCKPMNRTNHKTPDQQWGVNKIHLFLVMTEC